MIIHYGYSDGSGEFYITIDSDKCNACGKCVSTCPKLMLQLEPMFIDLEDKMVASVIEEQRKKLKYICASCKPETKDTPCMLVCNNGAIRCTWKSQ